MKIYHYSVTVVVFIWFSQVSFATNTMIFGNRDLAAAVHFNFLFAWECTSRIAYLTPEITQANENAYPGGWGSFLTQTFECSSIYQINIYIYIYIYLLSIHQRIMKK